jgi:hypothetical protein
MTWMSSSRTSAERSPEGAERLSISFEKAMMFLSMNPLLFALAPESDDLKRPVRHITFRTKAGRTYRALFIVVGDEVRVLRVRGAEQSNLTSDELEV